jgi:hypothetical protein
MHADATTLHRTLPATYTLMHNGSQGSGWPRQASSRTTTGSHTASAARLHCGQHPGRRSAGCEGRAAGHVRCRDAALLRCSVSCVGRHAGGCCAHAQRSSGDNQKQPPTPELGRLCLHGHIRAGQVRPHAPQDFVTVWQCCTKVPQLGRLASGSSWLARNPSLHQQLHTRMQTCSLLLLIRNRSH